MTSTVKRFVCEACGHPHLDWAARCAACRAWNLTAKDVEIEDVVPPQYPRLVSVPPEPEEPESELPRATPLVDVEAEEHERDETGLAPVDAVLGGGLVVASVVLVAAAPGSGKTTLALQLLQGLGVRSVYATAEETIEQLAVTARRLGATSKKLHGLAERDINTVLQYARATRAKVVVVDSLQEMIASDLDTRQGSPAHVKEVMSRIYRFAKDHDIAFWVISQVTGDDRVAGSRALEHKCDVLLELEVIDADVRALRCLGKNRYGASNVIGKLRMTDEGLVAVDGDGWDAPL